MQLGNNKKKLRILLLGAGKFGAHYVRILGTMHEMGVIELAGIVVRTNESRQALVGVVDAPVFTALEEALVLNVDGIVVATPPETHESLVSVCLGHASVLAEKPLSFSAAAALRLGREGDERGRVLMVGHIFRLHPLTTRLQEVLACSMPPRRIRGRFVNPNSAYTGRSPYFELLHFFDVLDVVMGVNPVVVSVERSGNLATIELSYGSDCAAHIVLGWNGDERSRWLEFDWGNRTLHADFTSSTLQKVDEARVDMERLVPSQELLWQELEIFMSLLNGGSTGYVNARVAAEVLSVSERCEEMYPWETEEMKQ